MIPYIGQIFGKSLGIIHFVSKRAKIVDRVKSIISLAYKSLNIFHFLCNVVVLGMQAWIGAKGFEHIGIDYNPRII